jgi:Flp pilus assembly protein TadD
VSVINNMLKDLDIRSSQFTPIEIATVGPAVTHKPGHSYTMTVTLIMLLLAVGLTFLYFQFLYHGGNPVISAKKIAEVVAVPAVPAPVKPPVDPLVAPVNQIIGLQIKETAENLSLQFSLRGNVISYLKERSKNKFVYHLKDIQSEIIAPKIRNNRWIEQLSITPRDQGVDIIFRTTASVLVETRERRQNGEPTWSIKLMKAPQPVAMVRPAETPLKAVAVPAPKKPVEGRVSSPEIQAKPELPTAEIKQDRVVKLDIKSSKPKPGAEEQLQRAVNLIKKRRWREAEIQLQRLINGPQDMAARTQLLGIYGQKGQAGLFSAMARESIQRYPKQSLFKTEYARALFKRKAYQSAIKLLHNIGNADATQLSLLAASYQRLDQHQQAIQYYKQSLDKNGKQAKAWIGLGISQEQMVQLKDALQSYQMATMIGDINPRLETFVRARTRQLKRTLN